MDEIVDLLDENGKVIGTQSKKEAHKTGTWHKAVHIYLINDKKELLLQQRTANKDIYPSVWDISVGGHVGAGEDTSVTACRELGEELGIKSLPEEFEYLTTTKEVLKTGNYISSEFVDVFLIRKNVTEKDIIIQKSEVADFKFVKLEEFFKMVKDKEKSLFPHFDEYEKIIPILKKLEEEKEIID